MRTPSYCVLAYFINGDGPSLRGRDVQLIHVDEGTAAVYHHEHIDDADALRTLVTVLQQRMNEVADPANVVVVTCSTDDCYFRTTYGQSARRS